MEKTVTDINQDLSEEEVGEINFALKEIKRNGINKVTCPIDKVAEELGVKLDI